MSTVRPDTQTRNLSCNILLTKGAESFSVPYYYFPYPIRIFHIGVSKLINGQIYLYVRVYIEKNAILHAMATMATALTGKELACYGHNGNRTGAGRTPLSNNKGGISFCRQ